MKRKRKVYYIVRCKGKWWCGKKIGWVEDYNSTDYKIASCSRDFFKVNKAINHIRTLPVGSTLIKVYFKNGKRYAEEWEKVM